MIHWALLGVATAIVAALVWKGFHSLQQSPRRSGPENNWTNEAYAAREEAGNWSESEYAPGRSSCAPPEQTGGGAF